MRDIFTQLHVISVDSSNELTSENLVKAVTLNENLASLGLTFKPGDIVKLAKSSELDTLYGRLKKYVGEVKADPMYPGFPNEVMNMDEAQFRMHQLIHYFTTYGIAALVGEFPGKGWLPKSNTVKTEKDKRLLDLTVVEIVDDIYEYSAEKILSKRERMTNSEVEIVKECAVILPASFWEGLSIPFKQNLMLLVATLADEKESDIIASLCKHSGDVLKCLRFYLNKNRWHLSTSQKKFWVRLLETYADDDFNANIILSRKKGEEAELLLRYLDYNKYSKSLEHKQAVSDLRAGNLKSWESKMRGLMLTDKDKCLDFISKRPGIMLRSITWLLRNGISESAISEKLDGTKLSTQTLVSLLSSFGKKSDEESVSVYNICLKALEEKMNSFNLPFSNKKVYIEEGMFDIEHSELLCNAKSEEGGYIPAGIAYRIPDCRHIRAFVYWNDDVNVDVDLHGAITDRKGDQVHIGWCSGFKTEGACCSGDITHSDAAEYIDMDTELNKEATINIDIYYGRNSFKEIKTCFAGLMAVEKLGENVELYDPANCFFTHNLTNKSRFIQYAYINLKERYLKFVGSPRKVYEYDSTVDKTIGKFTLRTYLDMLLKSQNACLVDKESAEVVLSVDKAKDSISLIDENFFLD